MNVRRISRKARVRASYSARSSTSRRTGNPYDAHVREVRSDEVAVAHLEDDGTDQALEPGRRLRARLRPGRGQPEAGDGRRGLERFRACAAPEVMHLVDDE